MTTTTTTTTFTGVTNPCEHSMAFHSARVAASISPNGGYASLIKQLSLFRTYASNTAPFLLDNGGTSHGVNPAYLYCVRTTWSKDTTEAYEFVCPL